MIYKILSAEYDASLWAFHWENSRFLDGKMGGCIVKNGTQERVIENHRLP